jgi:hypothetical protein
VVMSVTPVAVGMPNECLVSGIYHERFILGRPGLMRALALIRDHEPILADGKLAPELFDSGRPLNRFVTVMNREVFENAYWRPEHHVGWILVKTGDTLDCWTRDKINPYRGFVPVYMAGRYRLYRRTK